jgi:hypothetical protein
VNPEKPEKITIFLDPFANNSSQAMSILTKYASDYQLRFLITAMSDEHYEKLAGITCMMQNHSSELLVKAIINKQLPYSKRVCDQTRLMKSVALSRFLHISQSPTLIAPNDVFSTGMPAKLMSWLSDNSE